MAEPDRTDHMPGLLNAIEFQEVRLVALREFRVRMAVDADGPESLLWSRAYAAFEDYDFASVWLTTKNNFLENRLPIEAVETDMETVLDLLLRIQHGVYA